MGESINVSSNFYNKFTEYAKSGGKIDQDELRKLKELAQSESAGADVKKVEEELIEGLEKERVKDDADNVKHEVSLKYAGAEPTTVSFKLAGNLKVAVDPPQVQQADPASAVSAMTDKEADEILEKVFKDMAGSFDKGKVKGSSMYDNSFQEKILTNLENEKVRAALIKKFNVDNPDNINKLALVSLLEVDGGPNGWNNGGVKENNAAKKQVVFPLQAAIMNRLLGTLMVQGASFYSQNNKVPDSNDVQEGAKKRTFTSLEAVVGSFGVTKTGPTPQTAYGQMKLGGPLSLNNLFALWKDKTKSSEEKQAALAAAVKKGGADLKNALATVSGEQKFDFHKNIVKELLSGKITFEVTDEKFKDWEDGNKKKNFVFDPDNKFKIKPPVDQPPGSGGKREVNAGRFLNYAAHGDGSSVNVNEKGWIRTPNHEGSITGEHKYGTFSMKLPHPKEKGKFFYNMVVIPKSLIDESK